MFQIPFRDMSIFLRQNLPFHYILVRQGIYHRWYNFLAHVSHYEHSNYKIITEHIFEVNLVKSI